MESKCIGLAHLATMPPSDQGALQHDVPLACRRCPKGLMSREQSFPQHMPGTGACWLSYLSLMCSVYMSAAGGTRIGETNGGV